MLSLATCNASSLLDSALHYASLGFPVFPCTPGDKTPLVAWADQASTDPGQIRFWWSQWPTANLGLAMGRGWHALDIDRKNGVDGWLSYRALGGPQLPSWPRQHTPSGGIHLLLRGDYALSNFAKRGPHGGLDMRTDRGYILAAPSRVSGGQPYLWVDGNPDVPLPEPLGSTLIGYSTEARERTLEAFPIPDPAEVSPQERERLIDTLGASHARFLREGISETGDASKDAFHSCLRAFSSGWTLGQMAAIGPETHLAVFGAGEPHNAKDPWRWAWRYTVRAAWVASRDGQKEAPREGLRALGGRVRETNATESLPDTFEVLNSKAQGLLLHEPQQALDLVTEAFHAGLPGAQREILLGSIKRASGVTLQALRLHLRDLEKTRAARLAEQNKREIPEVYVRAQGRYFDPVSRQLISQEALITAKAQTDGVSISDTKEQWLNGGASVSPVVEDFTWDPRLPEGLSTDDRGVRLYNTYRGPTVRARPGTVEPWLALLDALQFEEECAREHLLDWCAWVVQHPGEKIQHGVLLGGDHGIGKDSVLAPFFRAVGEENVQTIGVEQLLRPFSSYLKGTKVLHLNEILLGDHEDRKMVNDKLKLFLASPPNTLQIEEKYLKPYIIPNLLQFVGCTNHYYCIAPDEGERRYAAFWCRAENPRDSTKAGPWADWFRQYHQWLEAGGHEHVAYFLQERDLARFDPNRHPPITSWFEAMIDYQRDPLEVWLIERVQEAKGPFASDMVTSEAILDFMGTGIGSHLLSGNMSSRRISQAMAKIGCQSARYWEGGSYRRAWLLRKMKKPEGATQEMQNVGVILRREYRFREQGR